MSIKRFKAKKKRKLKIIRYIFLFLFFFSYIFMISYLRKNRLKKNILSKDVNYVNFNIVSKINSDINSTIKNPVKLLNNNVLRAVKTESKKVSLDIKNANNIKEEKVLSDPIVYLYNTHTNEKYIDYDVISAASYLKDNLIKKGINSILEDKSVQVFLDSNNLKYYRSYDGSKTYIKEATQKYSTLRYFFDIHRDSVNKSKSTLEYNNKRYAKVLFLIGLENSNYKLNLENTNKLNNIIESKVSGISKGIYEKKGKGVNGVYNQDISPNLFLIEVGGEENTKEEVLNTLNVIYESIYEYIKGDV